MTFKPNSNIETLLEMLTYCRPSKSKSEQEFINRFLLTLPGAYADEENNIIVRVGGEPNTSDFFPVMWSSHTDTVHFNEGRQKIFYDIDMGTITLAPNTNSNCLGADCTAGVWLMCEMIQAGVPGLYIFHGAEELGGLGSKYISRHTPELLDGIQYAIAFDRKGYDSVVTTQLFETASVTFASKFAKLLSENWHNDWQPDEHGIFTDTANYANLIPECTNISVGYVFAHTQDEIQDVDFLIQLRDKILSIAKRIPSECPVERIPGVFTYPWHNKLYKNFPNNLLQMTFQTHNKETNFNKKRNKWRLKRRRNF